MPIPSPLWFPRRLLEQAAWLLNFHAQADATGTTYGLIAAEVDQIKDDRNMLEFLADTMGTINVYTDAIRGYRDGVLEDPIDGTTPTFPANITLAPPTAIPRGMFERIIDFSNRIKASAAYTQAVGELYGIVPSTPDPLAPSEVKPEINVFDAASGYLYTVVVSKREEADAWQVMFRPVGLTEWQLAATATGKSVDITYTPGGESPGPAQLQIRVQLRKNNANYGNPSLIAEVTVNP